MKKFLALMAMLFCTVLAIWVALRLAPETWAVIAGLIFGLVATIPMFAIVVMMLMRGHAERNRPDQQAVYYAPPPVQPSYVVLNADPAYAAHPGARALGGHGHAPAQLPPALAFARYGQPRRTIAPRAYFDRTTGGGPQLQGAATYHWAEEEEQWPQPEPAEDYWAPAPDSYQDPRQPQPRGAGVRILGE